MKPELYNGDVTLVNRIVYNASKPKRGDIAAVCTTGAYNFSMASNYNRLTRPPVVMLRGGQSYVAVRRETYEDLLSYDM